MSNQIQKPYTISITICCRIDDDDDDVDDINVVTCFWSLNMQIV